MAEKAKSLSWIEEAEKKAQRAAGWGPNGEPPRGFDVNKIPALEPPSKKGSQTVPSYCKGGKVIKTWGR